MTYKKMKIQKNENTKNEIQKTKRKMKIFLMFQSRKKKICQIELKHSDKNPPNNFEMSLSKGLFRMDTIVWALVHANTPGSVDESADKIRDRVMRMRCSAGNADAMEYWGGQLLRLHENPAPALALDECALALAMSQHADLGAQSSVYIHEVS